MDKIDLQEKVWGGIFGVIAIVAAIAEMFINGVSVSSVAGMIKDVSGTLVVVVLLVTVIKSLMPKKEKFSFEEHMNNAIETWKNENSNMIVKKDNSDGPDKFGLSMKTDVRDFYSSFSQTANAGWFVRIPKISEANYNQKNVEIDFHLNKGTFFEGSCLQGTELNKAFDKLSNRFAQFLTQKYAGKVIATGKNADIKVVIPNSIVDDEGINFMIDVINTTYQAFLVSANLVD